MKKLMIAAAVAAMGASVMADAQVYEYNLSLKTTTCKAGKVAANTAWVNYLGFEKGDEVVYRTQATMKLVGVTWGCECDTALAGEWNDRDIQINAKGDTVTVWDGITFWNPTTDAFLGGVYNGSEFDWSFINRMGKAANEVEMRWDLVPSADATDDAWEFSLAGFGKIKDAIVDDSDCNSIISSANGGVSGSLSVDGESWTCKYCNQWGATCQVYDFCDCGSFGTDDDSTVAYGTWTMKFNSAAAKKLQNTCLITQSYTKFTKYVKAELVAAGE